MASSVLHVTSARNVGIENARAAKTGIAFGERFCMFYGVIVGTSFSLQRQGYWRAQTAVSG